MTTVCSTFLFISKQAFGLNPTLAYSLGGVAFVVAVVWFCVWMRRESRKSLTPTPSPTGEGSR
jgi:hypothetical protein